jgi:16S rRNA (uracil1498-N3)-methyltransferase
MSQVTLCLDPEEFAGDTVRIEGDAYRHLFRARRLPKGARLRLVDGRGAARWGVVEVIDRRSAEVHLGEPTESNEPAYRLTLWIAAPRPERAAWLVEKTTELGVHAITFFSSERSPRRYGEGQGDRLRRMATAAVEQCHRARVPEITVGESWDRLEASLGAATEEDRIVLHPEGEEGGAWGAAGVGAGIVLVGPEGGFSAAEVEGLRGARFVLRGLGVRILRVETAAVVAASRLLLP